MNSKKVLAKAIERKVAFVPGESFYARGGGENTMRINFSYASPENIRIGIERLGNTIREEMETEATE
jgi:2-aminoadipate transaminase